LDNQGLPGKSLCQCPLFDRFWPPVWGAISGQTRLYCSLKQASRVILLERQFLCVLYPCSAALPCLDCGCHQGSNYMSVGFQKRPWIRPLAIQSLSAEYRGGRPSTAFWPYLKCHQFLLRILQMSLVVSIKRLLMTIGTGSRTRLNLSRIGPCSLPFWSQLLIIILPGNHNRLLSSRPIPRFFGFWQNIKLFSVAW